MFKTPRHGHFGMISDLALQASLPFELKPTSYVHEHGEPGLASAFSSSNLRKMVQHHMSTTVVSGLERDQATFQDVADIILEMGYTGQTSVYEWTYCCASQPALALGSLTHSHPPPWCSYVFGGFLRDAFKGVTSDDVDILFRSTTGSTVSYLESVARGRGWPCYRKIDEHTGVKRSDFIAVGTKGSRSKFSGHPIGMLQGVIAISDMCYYSLHVHETVALTRMLAHPHTHQQARAAR